MIVKSQAKSAKSPGRLVRLSDLRFLVNSPSTARRRRMSQIIQDTRIASRFIVFRANEEKQRVDPGLNIPINNTLVR